VLTPTYNYGRFLGDAITSVAAQAGGAIEHIIVDGGSRDETIAVLSSAPAGVIWRSEPDRGQSDALNKALAMASGEWIGWLNADEFYLPGLIRWLTQAIAQHPEADVIHGDAVFVDHAGRLLRLVAQHRFSPRVLRWNRCNISSCAMFVRREAIPERGWDVDLRATMDWDLYLEILRRGGKFAYLPRPIGAFRVHPDQVTTGPMPADSPDLARLAVRHGRPIGRRALVANQAGAFEHRVLKVVEGGLARELRSRRLRGTDMRWFASHDALTDASRVVEAASRH
jgi:glycosyltransferase involved in cell wall biosynthesis